MCRNVIWNDCWPPGHQSPTPRKEGCPVQDHVWHFQRFSLIFKILWWIAIGTNVFLRCHTNADFTMSICQVFLKGKSKYHLNDNLVVYFCFPTLGVAVPLCPGDYLMFNTLIPHAISFRCKFDNEIMCVSMFLKTAIVGLNNNDLELTPAQKLLANRYQNAL